MKFDIKNVKICVVGLGYVGLPLSVAFSSKFKVIGFDINNNRINDLNKFIDKTLEVDSIELKHASQNGMKFTTNLDEIKACNFFIVTVPTPIDKNKRPDLTPLIKASESIGKILKKDDIVVYESTVYPGAIEEECVPVLEKFSGLKFNKDFFCGYSPERINPGDKDHKVSYIKKVISGSTKDIAKFIDEVYSKIITAGTFIASSIKVAEAAKVIENTQRDINIAFVNELAMLFNKIRIDVNEVLDAAATKWNFLNFRPGLVGGHCIGVDPYYLTHKAQEIGYNPEMILAGRRINDNMGKYVANQIIKLMIKNNKSIKNGKILILGITFKENCPDIRNSKVMDVINELNEFGCKVDVFDPWADKNDVQNEYGLILLDKYDEKDYDCIVLAVAHNKFKNLKFNSTLVYDIKGFYDNANERL